MQCRCISHQHVPDSTVQQLNAICMAPHAFWRGPLQHARDLWSLQMGEALIRGFCKSGVSSVEQISASVRSFDRQRALSALGLRVYGNALEGGAADLAANSEIIFLGVS